MATTRTTSDFADFGGVEIVDADFGDRRKHKKHHRHGNMPTFGNATKRKLKRPYKRSVVRKGRKLVGKKKIGHVSKSARNKFAYVTRGGSVYEASVSKKGGRKAPKRRKAARKGRKK
jgi:hypothetical protein